MQGEESVNCAICGSVPGRPVIEGRVRYVKCGSCGLIYKNPRIMREEWVNHLASSCMENAGERFYRAEKKLFSGVIKLIENRHPGSIRLLDVGCGYGAFLRLAKEKGWDVEGTEMGREAADFVSGKCGVTVHRKTI